MLAGKMDASSAPTQTPSPKILVIDDLRIFHDLRAQYARNSAKAVAALAGHDPWDEVWFDHDLGAYDDIRTVLSFIEMRHNAGAPVRMGKCVVHTSNPVGASVLCLALNRMGYKVERVYAGSLNVSSLGTSTEN